MIYTVREAAEKLKIPSSTIRFYDKNGLLPFVERSPGGVRMFTDADIARIQDILVLKSAGFQIKEIARFIQLEDEGDASLLVRLEMLKHRSFEVEAEIVKLKDTLEILRGKVQCYEAALKK